MRRWEICENCEMLPRTAMELWKIHRRYQQHIFEFNIISLTNSHGVRFFPESYSTFAWKIWKSVERVPMGMRENQLTAEKLSSDDVDSSEIKWFSTFLHPRSLSHLLVSTTSSPFSMFTNLLRELARQLSQSHILFTAWSHMRDERRRAKRDLTVLHCITYLHMKWLDESSHERHSCAFKWDLRWNWRWWKKNVTRFA